MRYFLASESGDGYLNLARDEHLLNSLPAGDMIMHLYVNRRAVIIGRNQNPWRECNLNQLDADGVQLVRRASGGGAVYHDTGNLNFSFICQNDAYDEGAQTGVILSALKSLGVDAQVSGRNDMECAGRKFSGNAYCQRGKNRQRHGTLLVRSDLTVFDKYLCAPAQKLAAKGVASVRARVMNLCEIQPALTVERVLQALKAAYEARYGEAREYEFMREDDESIRALKARHESWDWRMGEAPAFDYAYEHKFPWGMAQICATVVNGRIVSAKLYTDSLNYGLPALVEPLLAGARFTGAEIYEKLAALGGEAADIGEYMACNLP